MPPAGHEADPQLSPGWGTTGFSIASECPPPKSSKDSALEGAGVVTHVEGKEGDRAEGPQTRVSTAKTLVRQGGQHGRVSRPSKAPRASRVSLTASPSLKWP